MRHNFDQQVDRRGSDCKKYEAASYPADVIPMWIADTDFAVPAEIAAAIRERAEHPCYGYPVESFAFEESAARWEEVRFGWEIDPHWVKYANGVLPFLMYAVRAFSHPGDHIVIQPPIYPPFPANIQHNGRRVGENPLRQDAEGRYQIDFEDLEKKLADPKAKLLFLCNPHNPAMRCYTLEELTRIGELCLRHNVIVMSDEIHCDLTYQGYRHIPFGSIRQDFADNCIVMINPSKTFNIAGFRTGAAIIPNQRLRDEIQSTIVSNKNYGRTIFGMISFITAYTQCDYYADELMDYLQGNRDLLMDALKTRIPRIKMSVPEATYLMWLDCRELGMDQPELKRFFFEKAKLGLNDGVTFGQGGLGHMRMNIACPRATLEQALDRLERAVNAL